MKWVWVTPYYFDRRENKYVAKETEVLLNLSLVKFIQKEGKEGDFYTIWFLSEGPQESIIINREGFNSIPCLV